MPGQTKAGDVGHRMGNRGQQRRSVALGAGHLGDAGLPDLAQHQPGDAGQSHFGGQDRARAQGFGQDQRIAGPRPALGNHAWGDSGDGETDGQLGPFGGVAADDVGPGVPQHAGGFVHDLGQHARLQVGAHRRQRNLRKGGLRRGPHRPDVAQRVQGGQPGHQAGVGAKAAQMVGGQDLHAAARLRQHGGIIAGAGQNLGALGRGQVGKRRGQYVRTKLCPAAATQGASRQMLCQAFGRVLGHRGRRHGGQVGKLVHEGAVDPVLQPPKPGAGQGEAPFVGDGIPCPKRDQLEVVALRAERAQGLAGQGSAQVMVQDGGGADGEDPGLGARIARDRGAIAHGKDQRVGGPQVGRGGQETPVVVQTDPRQPGMRTCACDGQSEVRADLFTADQNHPVRGDTGNLDSGPQDHPFGRQPGQHLAAGAGTQSGQKRRGAVHQRDLRPGPALPQPVQGGQRKFHPAKARAQDHDAGKGQATGDKDLPRGGIAGQGLGRDGVVGPRQIGQVRGDAHVDRRQVIGHGRAALQVDLAAGPVQPGGAVQDQPRPGKAAQAHQVDHQVIAPVMASDVAGQHAGVGGGRGGVDHGQPRAGQRVHRPHLQDQSVRMAAADQDKVADRGEGRGHRAGFVHAGAALRLTARGPEKREVVAPSGRTVPARWRGA